MKLINSNDADNRERLNELEKNAKRASALIDQHEGNIRAMQTFAVETGIPAEEVSRINPIAYCHEVLTRFAIEKLRE